MTNQKKLSRRDAIKLLGAAAGASVLANLPSKWSKPELADGVLPAHAQTSNLGFQILSCTLDVDWNTGAWSSVPTVGPTPVRAPDKKYIVLCFTLTFVNVHFKSSPDPQKPNPYSSNWTVNPSTGQIKYINSDGVDPLDILVLDKGFNSGSFSILWEFCNPSEGTGSCSQTSFVNAG